VQVKEWDERKVKHKLQTSSF